MNRQTMAGRAQQARPGGQYRFHLVGLTLFAALIAVAEVNFPLMRELALARYGASTAQTVAQWQSQLEAVKSSSEQDRLAWTNDYFNSTIRWEDDTGIWAEKDYWATPLELIGRGMGDCEDYAIAKYMSLVLSGIAIEKLRITYVRLQYQGRPQAHMVLVYYPTPTAEPLILDNVRPQILPASKRSDLEPVYGFNSLQGYAGSATTPSTTDPLAKLSRWRDLLSRAAAEGLG